MATVNARFVTRYGMTRLELRQMLYKRQGGLCPLCHEPLGKKYVTSKWINLDHRRPIAHGGPDTLDNIDLVHKECNHDKADRCDGCSRCE